MLAAFCPCRPVTGCRALRARPAAAASFAAPNSRPGEPFMKRGGEASDAALVDVGQRELVEHRARLDVAERDARGPARGQPRGGEREPSRRRAGGGGGGDEDRPEENAAACPGRNGRCREEHAGVRAEVAPTTADAAPSARAARQRPATAAPMTLPNAVRHQVPIDIGELGLTIRSMATKRLDRPRSEISSPEALELFAAGAHVGGEHQSKAERAFV